MGRTRIPVRAAGVGIAVVITFLYIGGILGDIASLIVCTAAGAGFAFMGIPFSMRPIEMSVALDAGFLNMLRYLRAALLFSLGATFAASVLYTSSLFLGLVLGQIATSATWIYISHGQVWKFKHSCDV